MLFERGELVGIDLSLQYTADRVRAAAIARGQGLGGLALAVTSDQLLFLAFAQPWSGHDDIDVQHTTIEALAQLAQCDRFKLP